MNTTTAIRGLTDALEAAREVCEPPTWRALAIEIGCYESNLANIRKGEKTLSDEQLKRLAKMLEMDPAALWEMQEMARWPKRNPFRSGVAAIGALIGTFIAAVLIAGAGGLNRSQATEKAAKNSIDPMHIVALVLRKTYTALRALCLMFGQLQPMVAR